MKIHERLDHLLRQYNYKRKRSNDRHKRTINFDLQQYLDEVDTYVGELMEQIDRALPANKKRDV